LFFRIPWDVEASMGQDNTLGGSPGDLWCILACEQWNSPLYCDSEHPQVGCYFCAVMTVTCCVTNVCDCCCDDLWCVVACEQWNGSLLCCSTEHRRCAVIDGL
jgi:hypothetical protein